MIQKVSPDEALAQKPSVADLRLRKRLPIFAVWEDVRSRYNVGAMFRTSDAALVSKVVLSGMTSVPPHPDIDKCALGATDVVPWQYYQSSVEALHELKGQGVSVVALELTKQSMPHFQHVFSFPMCLIVGNEIDGVSEAALALSDAAISIPMMGRATSLNVATAYGIALYEAVRQFQQKSVL